MQICILAYFCIFLNLALMGHILGGAMVVGVLVVFLDKQWSRARLD